MERSVVVLPQPEGPSRVKSLPLLDFERDVARGTQNLPAPGAVFGVQRFDAQHVRPP